MRYTEGRPQAAGGFSALLRARQRGNHGQQRDHHEGFPTKCYFGQKDALCRARGMIELLAANGSSNATAAAAAVPFLFSSPTDIN